MSLKFLKPMHLNDYRKLSREEKREFHKSRIEEKRDCNYRGFDSLWMMLFKKPADPKVAIHNADQMVQHCTTKLYSVLDFERVGDLELKVLHREIVWVVVRIMEGTDHELDSDELKSITDRVMEITLGGGVAKLKSACKASPQNQDLTKRLARWKIVTWFVWPIGLLLSWAFEPIHVCVSLLYWAMIRITNFFIKDENKRSNRRPFDEYLACRYRLDQTA